MEKKIIQVDEKVPVKMLIPLSLQHYVCHVRSIGAGTVSVWISPAIVLLMNGVGTLGLYRCKQKEKHRRTWVPVLHFWFRRGWSLRNSVTSMHWEALLPSDLAVFIVALIIRKFGTKLDSYRAADSSHGTGCSLIGLELAGNAASNAGLLDEVIDPKNVIVFW